MDCHPRYYNKRLSIFCRNVKPNALYGYPPPMELGDLSALKPVLRGVLPYWCKSQVLPTPRTRIGTLCASLVCKCLTASKRVLLAKLKEGF